MYYLSKGSVLSTLQRVLWFTQSLWLKSNIGFCYVNDVSGYNRFLERIFKSSQIIRTVGKPWRTCGREWPKRDDVEYLRSPTFNLLRSSIKTWRTSISEKATLFSIAQVSLIFFLFLTWLSCPGTRLTTTLSNLQTEKRPLVCSQTRIAFAMIAKKDFYQNMFHKTLFDTSYFLIHFLFSKWIGRIHWSQIHVIQFLLWRHGEDC